MKKRFLVGSLLAWFCALELVAAPVGTAFTYQGRLTTTNGPANGLYDFEFYAYTSETGYSGYAMNTNAVPVSNGLFTVLLDFGPGVFTGDARWLRIGVRSNSVAVPPEIPEPFVVLNPRVPITATPFAQFATLASNVAPGSISAANLALNSVTATKIASGQVVKTLNGFTDAVLVSAGTNFSIANNANVLTISATPGTVVTNGGWSVTGNSGTTTNNFVGTTDGQPLELRVGGQRALRLENNSGEINVIGGGPANFVGTQVQGGTIGGGTGNTFPTGTGQTPQPTISGGSGNTIEANSYQPTIGGGYNNRIQYDGDYVTIAGGTANVVGTNADNSAIGGGVQNRIAPAVAAGVIPGGNNNSVAANYGTVGGGQANRAAGDSTAVGGGFWNLASDVYGTVVGGYMNTNESPAGALGGGWVNHIFPNANNSTIAGGAYNWVGTNSWNATIPGGQGNSVGPNAAGGFAAGLDAHVLHPGSFVWGDGMGTASSTGSNRFEVHATAGAYYYAGTGKPGLVVVQGNGTASPLAGTALYGLAYDNPGIGVYGAANGVNGFGVYGSSSAGTGGTFSGGQYGVYAQSSGGDAGYFSGNVRVSGNLTLSGTFNFAGSLQASSLTAPADQPLDLNSGTANIFRYDPSVGSLALGRNAHATHSGSFVWGDGSRSAGSSSTNHFDVLATGGAYFWTDNGYLSVQGKGLDLGGGFGNEIRATAGLNLNSGSNWVSIGSSAGLVFGAQTRQMLNLYNYDYAIGVQNNAQYYRSASDFYWFKGGTHSDSPGDAGTNGTSIMHLDSAGTLFVKVLTVQGADVAEPFQMSSPALTQGSVVVIDEDHPGQLKQSTSAYDRRVAGIISGAGGVRPGLSLQQLASEKDGQNVALTGRVYVQADASNGAIRPGDLLTTSSTPGHAMKVTDHARAQGEILGKAMTPLAEGQGFVLVLVTLQ